ncbi:unnamed protein product [Schistosoma mattheei]|uniref:RRM domain-containing protein n=1 Tax=Schistosoma mattheei TaxID=31246 RepID=A0AA85BJF9_9TREM|nr:unnamed protein product [Schistosoma mattheei]
MKAQAGFLILMENVESRITDKKYVLDSHLKPDEAEEGEVNDLSDQEDNVSDFSSNSGSSKSYNNPSPKHGYESCTSEMSQNGGLSLSTLNMPSVHHIRSHKSRPVKITDTANVSKKTNTSPANTKSEVRGQTSSHENQTTKLQSIVNCARASDPQILSEQVEPFHTSMSVKSTKHLQGLRDLEKVQLQMQLEVATNQNEHNHTSTPYPSSSQQVHQSVFPGFVPGGTPKLAQNSVQRVASVKAVSENINGDNRFGLSGSWQVAIPPSSALGSQQEIEKMHMMYQKACQLYQRAVATIGSTPNVSIQPPPFGTPIGSPPSISLQSFPPTLMPVISVERPASVSPSKFIPASQLPHDVLRDIPNQCIGQNPHIPAIIPNHAHIASSCANDPVFQSKLDFHNHHDSKRLCISSNEGFHRISTVLHPEHSNRSSSPSDSKNVTNDGSKSDLSSSKYLWISNLPQGVRAVDIKEMCAPYGKVQTIKIVGSKKSKPPSIYAYLIMETSEAAVRLIKALQGVKFSGNELKIKQGVQFGKSVIV